MQASEVTAAAKSVVAAVRSYAAGGKISVATRMQRVLRPILAVAFLDCFDLSDLRVAEDARCLQSTC